MRRHYWLVSYLTPQGGVDQRFLLCKRKEIVNYMSGKKVLAITKVSLRESVEYK